MEQILKLAKGKKTYIIAIAAAVLGTLQGLEVFVMPTWAWPIIAAAGFGALRAGVNKVVEEGKSEKEQAK
ncbi:MAG: hypothetical protein ACYTBZ_27650 [Planctomycetota bacterium]|jgi:hypothetical protein